ncbi:hypothetical protein EES43_01875 [Streptomyces sp. ADI96-02]|uniref:hypothetical protein n=1 Tax=unclassified Streptomyces TaxID=2593676 RepID=UPI000F551C9C|nr:hypothetical protein [Streptomyces sp. ADI96-02]RPK68177.1 hypothetical protein EES43_01875 [Streptomyces sp. ADI96-02]
MTRAPARTPRSRHTLTLTAAVAAVTLAGALPAGAASPAAHPQGCSVRTLQGDFGGNYSGTSAGTGPLAFQGLVTFNGDGTATAKATLMSETSGPTSITAVIDYTLKRDCTGTMTSQRSNGQTIHYVFTVVADGTELALLQTDPGFVVTARLTRVRRG